MARPPGNRSGSYDLIYNPYQIAFLQAVDRCICGRTDGVCPGHQHAFNRLAIFAGRRGGKTKIGAVAAVRKALSRACYGWVCAPTFGDLNDFVMPAFFAAMPDDAIVEWSARFYELSVRTLDGGISKVAFRSLDNPDDARGPGLDWAWLDEACKISKVAWQTMLPALIDKKGIAWFTTTPRSFDWCYKQLWVPATTGRPGFWAIQYRTIDNPIIDKALVEEQRGQMDPLFYQQEFEASFVSFTGSVYNIEAAVLDNDDEIRRLIPEWPRIDPSRPAFLGMDPGADHPFAAVLSVKTSQGIVVIGEYERRNLPIAQHVVNLQQILSRDNPAQPWQPSPWAIDRSQRQTAIELSTYGIYVQGAENDVINGIRRVQSWLSAGQLFFIGKRVPKLIEKLRSYRWAENTTADGEWKNREAVIKEEDDLPDALRYALMSWPELPEKVESNVVMSERLQAFDEKTRVDLDRQARIARREADPDAYLDEMGSDVDIQELGPMGDFWHSDGTGTGRAFFGEDE